MLSKKLKTVLYNSLGIFNNPFKMSFFTSIKAKQMVPTTEWRNSAKTLDPIQVDAYFKENLIMVDNKNSVLGPISKGEGHTMEAVRKPIYHRALSLLVFDSSDRFLLTQRSASKITFPNYYTNACCSHPLYNDQELEEDGNAVGVKRAVVRRSQFELGTKLDEFNENDLKLVNKLCYRAESDGGHWGEAEIDYIFILHKNIHLNLNKDEVQSFLYVTRQDMHEILSDGHKRGIKVTPWMRLLARDHLFNYWDNLRTLDKIASPDKIIMHEEIFPVDIIAQEH